MATNRKVVDRPEPKIAAPKPTQALKIKLDNLRTFEPLTDNQRHFFDSYKRGDYFIALHGCAGTGKTFVSLYKALEEVLCKDNSFTQIIIVRSAVQGREVGHLPGDMEEKLEIYEQPYRQICSILFERHDAYARLKEQGVIQFVSTSFVRGLSFDNAIVIVDEIQNLSYSECSTVMTRVGHMSKIIWCGDYRQTDLKKSNDKSGLKKFMEIADNMDSHTRIEFTVDDIIRSSLVREFIIAEQAYHDEHGFEFSI